MNTDVHVLRTTASRAPGSAGMTDRLHLAERAAGRAGEARLDLVGLALSASGRVARTARTVAAELLPLGRR